jgi:uncharacterized protein involved in outer membrane biogenesis
MTATSPMNRPGLADGAGLERRALRWLGLAFAVLVTAWLLAFALFDWDWARVPIARLASDAAGRRVRIDGHLRVHLLSLTPRLTVGGLKIGQPAWAGDGDMAEVDQLIVEARLLPLLAGRLVLPLLELDRANLDLRSDAKNGSNWSLGKGGSGGTLPTIERFVVDQGHLRFFDARRKLTIVGVIDTNERAGGPAAHAFSLEGEGTLNAEPFHLKLDGGPLINVKSGAPYPFSSDIHAGQTHVVANGTLSKALNFDAYSTDLHLTGPDLARLYDLIGIPLPNTPAYDLHGRLDHQGKIYDFTGIAGRLGDSDLAGRFSVTTANGRPFVDAWLRSRLLDFKDLGVLFGGPPPVAGKAASSPGKPAALPATAAQPRLFPDATLATEKLRKIDANLDYAAGSVANTVLPLRHVRLKLTLDRGLLTADPLDFDFPQGRLTSKIVLNGRGEVPVTSLDARLSNAELRNFVPGAKGAPAPIEGQLAARVKLTGAGDSVHRVAANADGAVTLVIPHGHMRQAFAELLGVNAGKGLSLLLSKNNAQSEVRCGVAAFDVHHGQMAARTIVFDTDVVRVNGTGGANLWSETLDLVFKGDSKKARLLHVLLPITVRGNFRSPELGVQPGSAIAQGGAAVALGAALGPLAAILPFVDPGLGKSADCAALMSEAKSAPAPVKSALPVTPAAKK